MRLLVTTAIVLASVISSLAYAQGSGELNVGVSASVACQQDFVRIDWTMTNLEDKNIEVIASDQTHNEQSSAVSAEPNETITSSFTTDARQTEAGEVSFKLTAESGKTTEKSATYDAKVCSEEPEDEPAVAADTAPQTPPAQDLPTTGPLDGIALYMAMTLATASAWLVTRKELTDALRQR